MNDYFTFFYVKHFELPMCMKCAIQINLPCLALHSSDQHVLHFITVNKQYFWKIKQFLTNVCDFIKYIMQYNSICVTAKLQLASSYT